MRVHVVLKSWKWDEDRVAGTAVVWKTDYDFMYEFIRVPVKGEFLVVTTNGSDSKELTYTVSKVTHYINGKVEIVADRMEE
jgi:hypothetical protein